MESHDGLIGQSSNSPQPSGTQKHYTRIELTERLHDDPAPPTSQSFFSWIKDRDAKKASIRNTKIIPWKGIIAFSVSILTTLLTLVVLLILQHRKELFPTTGIYKVMQPASWLSALMSLNGAALHIALIEGVTVAWWYRATRPTANLSQLHSLWASGTSSFGAVKHVHTLSHVSLAALFVAILPLNGFLLQAAVTTPVTLIQEWSQIPVPMAKTLPFGYSGSISFDEGDNSTWGIIDTVSYPGNFPLTFQQVKNVAGSKFASYAYFGAYDECGSPDQTNCTSIYELDGTMPADDNLLGKKYYFNDTLSTFSFKAQGTGFNVSCEESKIPYNLLSVEGEPPKNDSIFETTINWNYSDPNTITLEMKWKGNASCVGEYEHRFCTLKAATVEYPMEMQLDIADQYRGPFYSLPVNTTWKDDKIIEELPIYPNESVAYTTFGGIALKFSEWYDAYTFLTFPVNNAWRSQQSGPLSFGTDFGFWDNNDSDQGCRVDMRLGLSYVNYFEQLSKRDYKSWVEFGPYASSEIGDPVDLVLNQIRQSMFLASVYEGASWYSWSYNWNVDGATFLRSGEESQYIQTVDALRSKRVPAYKIRWGLWGASVAMTYAIILIMIPLFYGFWVLKMKPTLSPVDVARAFNAPVVDNDHQNQMDVDSLLKEVGRKNIHQDLTYSHPT